MVLIAKHQKIFKIAIHVLFWLTWAMLPIILVDTSSQGVERAFHDTFIRMAMPLLFTILLFYVNYFVLVDKLLYHKRILLFLLVNVLLIITMNYFTEMYFSYIKGIYPEFFPQPKLEPRPPRFFLKMHNLLHVFVIAVSVALKATSHWYVSERKIKNLENENLKSELSNLKMQLNPHFFFNTLNNIYALISISPDKAQSAVHGLSKLMRYHLYETNEELVPLGGELDAIQNYIALMRLRLTDNVEVKIDLNIQHEDLKIAPLLFIPLIENAFKHGVNANQKSEIEITFSEVEGVITFETINTNAPQIYEDEKERKEKGIGLDNLRKRLALIYPNKNELVTEVTGSYFKTKLILRP